MTENATEINELCPYEWADGSRAAGKEGTTGMSHRCRWPAGHDADPRTDRHECECGAWDYSPAERLTP